MGFSPPGGYSGPDGKVSFPARLKNSEPKKEGTTLTAGRRVARLLHHAVDVRDGEIRALLWSFAYFFCILCSYYILRPLRDEMGIAGGVRALPWMFTGTFLAMLGVVPLFGAIVARFPRRRFIPYVYWFFIANLFLFWLLLTLQIGKVYVARTFFIWTSVFNLFIVSVFWSFMADLFRNEQSRRLFGFIAAGGTAGTILGPLITVTLAVPLGPQNLLLISGGLLGASLLCVRRLVLAADEFMDPAAKSGVSWHAGGAPKTGDEASVIGGGVFGGITEVLKSPYLMGISFFFLIFTTTSTVLYFEQAHVVAAGFADPGQRTRVFAFMDLSVSTLTILVQLFVTGKFIRYFGVGSALCLLPAVTLTGFALFAWAPTLGVLVVFQILRRTANFSVTRPGREMLFTVISREQKYKAKNFIDTVIYRGGDALSGWLFAALSGALALGLAPIAALCVPLSALWAGIAWMLGQHQDKLAQKAGLLPSAPTVAPAD